MEGSPLSSWARALAKPQAAALLRPSDRHEGAAAHPFPVADRAAYKAELGMGNGAVNERIEAAPVVSTLLEGLVGIQRTVQPAKVQEYIDQPGHLPAAGPAPTDHPIVVKMGGTRYIHDGHHRLTAAKLQGRSEAMVRLVDLDAERAGRP